MIQSVATLSDAALAALYDEVTGRTSADFQSRAHGQRRVVAALKHRGLTVEIRDGAVMAVRPA
ncbi:hypothetical protein [Methylobacterium nodulans]|uniref:Uncharacterized protein n=1 Tax=Methylobacterium nodulans (strain LMG 21967 / CNCM I-2342 / ORS 2060) TaxID=460265 RepID=B8IVF9_METNO|nr:hypothetical protein [Methylobacterium nodulans]ACL61010.1 hypothetical protein Mnod_6202 [Methylobacterium nodulans ORS 2060]